MSFRHSLYATSAVALFTFTSAAYADETPGDNFGARTIIVTANVEASAAQAEIDRTPGGADLISYQDYADKSVMSLRDTLAFSPGVYLQPRYGQEVRISIRGSGLSRGFHMRGLTLLQDGVPINLADDNGDFQEMEPIFFDHMEVYRGANALRFGSGTLGGAINGVTPKGTDAQGHYLRADGGSFNTLRGLASYGGASGAADFWAGVSADTSDGDRDHARRHSLRFHGNVGLQLSDTVETRFYGSVNHINQELPGALTYATATNTPRQGNFNGDQHRDIDSIRLQNRTTWHITEDATLEGGVFLNVKSLYHPIFQVVDQESTDRGAYARASWAYGPVELTLGGEIRIGSVASKRFINMDGKRGALTFEADQKARTAQLYGELRYKPVESLSLIAGGVYADGFRRQYEKFNMFAGGPTGVHGRAEFSEVSPKFGLLFAPTTAMQFYANYSRSAEFPGFIELAQVNSFVSLDPQTAWTAEIGTRGSLGIAQWDVSLYRADVTNEMLQYRIAPDYPASTFNADKTRHQGIEAALTLTPTDWLQLRQVYQYNNFRFRNDAQYGDNRLPVVPRHVYRAELRLGSDALHVAPNVEWTPKGGYADYDNLFRTGGYALLGFSAGATVSDSIDIFVDARNLTNKKAVGDISAIVPAAGATANDVAATAAYYPIERRAIYGGVRMRF
ncbi:MAG: TonB-dependent receptor [Sphingobium sp.]|nr:TonB-dependent receptor [Sphingobium sp.]MCP5399847.1 TonB-dependent receptor [Sphingomonas sp.]